MRKTTRSFITFVLLLVLLTTVSGTAFAAPPARAKWTVMVYISGDNNLEDYVVKDIELELAPTGSSADVQLVALAADIGHGIDPRRSRSVVAVAVPRFGVPSQFLRVAMACVWQWQVHFSLRHTPPAHAPGSRDGLQNPRATLLPGVLRSGDDASHEAS